MISQPAIAIFDIGKTNKKIFLFNEDYKIIYEKIISLMETEDEDGFPCEDVVALRTSIFDSLSAVIKKKEFDIKAINFSSYGASFVFIDEKGFPLTSLYSYLKPYPSDIQNLFYSKYGGEEKVSLETCSPVLGSLNSGLQLLRIKYQHPNIFNKIKYALHLPQYLSFLLSNQAFTDITSIGCHTNLWHFKNKCYHNWVIEENIIEKLAPIMPSDYVTAGSYAGIKFSLGIGLHDSSAALIPYMINFSEPFMLISTGTWCISFNPFNQTRLNSDELKLDCLCYLNWDGKPVKASRLFAGYEHDKHVKRISQYFNQESNKYKFIQYNPEIVRKLKLKTSLPNDDRDINITLKSLLFEDRDLGSFIDYEEAYHQLILDIIIQQHASANLVIQRTDVKKIYVDGGFSKNEIYMNLLSSSFPEMKVFAASIAQSTAFGAALAIHSSWNSKEYPSDMIKLKYYPVVKI